MSEKAYYLASVADKIYLNPQGVVEFNGLSSKVLFFKKMFEKVGVQPEIFRVGEYKSAVEPFLLEKMSDANRLQTKSYLESMYGFYLQNVSQTRGIAVERLKQISDSMLVRKAGDAVKYGLITDTVYYDQVEKELKTVSGIGEEEKVKFTSMKKYIKAKSKGENVDTNQEIAVVIAEGTIVSGKGGDGYVGSDKIASKLRELRENEDVKAVVLRINSPGGSALASDVMWREVRLMSEKKPIIASMSDVAASGGYYMAMGCDAIVAQPNTITGSIGIFGLLFNLTELMQNKMGIKSDAVGTGSLSDFGDPTDGLTEVEKQIIQNMINDGYETFTSKAALGRKMTIDELKKYASGRVWSGAEAKQIGLIDALGGLQVSIDMAAEKAGLSDNYNVKYYPKDQNFFEKFTSNLEESGAKWMLKNKLGELYPIYEQVEHLKTMQGVQARLPYDVVID
jgi:protease-4